MTLALEVNDLEVRRKRFTLGPLSFKLHHGRATGLVGPNGSGKTTTLRCIAGNLHPDRGFAAVYGRKSGPLDGSWKELIGYVPDKSEFFEYMTAGGFLQFMSRFYSGWSPTLAATLSSRFKLDLGAKLKHLSSGNRTKVSLVAALSHRPKLALLDEPTAGIDPFIRSEIFDALWEMMESEEMTILYSTHIVEDLQRLADDIVFLENGGIRLQASKDDLIDKWLRIRFHTDEPLTRVECVVADHSSGHEKVVISSDGQRTIESLSRLGAERIRGESLSLDEIAVNIMKESYHASPHIR